MGACLSQTKPQPFSADDIPNIENYFSLMSKRKAEIFSWLIASQGPWEKPASFVEFKLANVPTKPVRTSNEEEIRLCLSRELHKLDKGSHQSSILTLSSLSARVEWPSDW